MLPEGWRWERLPEAAEICDHLRRPISNAERIKRNAAKPASELYPYYGATGQAGEIDGYLADGDYILLGEDGAPFLDSYKRKAYSVSGKFWVNNHAHVLKGKSHLDSRLLLHWLNILKYDPYVNGTTRLKLTQGSMVEIPVPIPPAGRQMLLANRIDDLFTEIDDGEAALVRARLDLVTWRKALLKAAVTGELTADWRAANPSTETGADLLASFLEKRRLDWEAEPRNRVRRYKEPPGPIVKHLPVLPKGWTWASLAQVSFISGGLTVDAKRKPLDPVELPYLRVANVRRGNLDLRKIKSVVVDRSVVDGLRLEAGDILLNEGGDLDKLGRGWVYEGQIPNCLHQNHVFKARPVSDSISPYFASMYLNEIGRHYFIDQGKQTTNLASISLSKVSTAPIPVPPLAEAIEALRLYNAQSLPDMDENLDDLIKIPAILRQSILAATFRGDLL